MTVIRASASGALGQRRPTLPVFAVTFSGIRLEAGTTSVRGPGQNFSPRVKKRRGGSRVNSAAWSKEATRRSEEHTSELQSLAYLVCRLLLEKKKKKQLREVSHQITLSIIKSA